MSWVDLSIIAILVLFAGFGVLKGVQKSSLALGAFAIAFVISFFLANVVAEALLNIEGIRGFVLGNDGWSLYMWINEGMADSPWLEKSFVGTTFYKPIYEAIKSYAFTANFTVRQGVAASAAFTLFAAIVGVALYIVIRALLCIATMIIKSFVPRKKSVGNRVAGFFVGSVRGAAWTFVITLIFSTICGFTFVGGFNSIEKEYESSVLGQFFNKCAYGMKNSMFIPDKDRFARIVQKAGLSVEEGDLPVDPLESKRNELYADIMNLNYRSGTKYTVENGVIVEHDGLEILNASTYVETGFDTALQAIIEYNQKIGEGIKNGILDDANAVKIEEYNTAYSGIYTNMSACMNAIGNYNKIVTDDSFGTNTSQEIVDRNNSELASYYAEITAALDAMKTEYAKFDLFIADESTGELVIPDYPDVIVETVSQPLILA